MRKLWIGLIAFVLVGLGFWAYIKWMDTAPIPVPTSSDAPDVDMPSMETDVQTFGDAKIKEFGQTQYFKIDPVTKDIVAEYGFELLLNPGDESSRWRVQKPYLVFYQSDYQCRIDAAQGLFQVESAGDQSIFKDAQLNEDVEIHLTPNPGSRMAETTIFMDDLTFSSERSEFSTDGPISIQSAQMELEGYGLILIFNTGLGKVEYVQIKDLDFLRLRDYDAPSSARNTSSDAVSTGSEQPVRPRQEARADADGRTAADAADSADSFYRCVIRDNVVIQYGDELVVSGADQVDILNIHNTAESSVLPGSRQNDAGRIEERNVDAAPAAVAASNQSNAETTSLAAAAQDVIVRCDGGLVIQPMEPAEAAGSGAASPELAFEMQGTPLKIDRLRSGPQNGQETLAHCGILSYKPAEDILRLFTNSGQPQILLNTAESNSRIETHGNVYWDRKSQRANIAGPGTVFIGNDNDPSAIPSEIAFNGVMDLLFAPMPNNMASAAIRTINLTGGMDAVLRQNGTLKTLADSAVLEFGHENQLAEARLHGDVRFESLEAGQPSSKAAAESAVFHFDDNRIAAADLNGGVQFESASGRMDSPNARIEFAPDAKGAMHPAVIRTDGDSVLQTVSSDGNQPPAKFEAKKIDYDMQTGAGLAHGPIRFTFYQSADATQAATDAWIPVTITADENARFMADADRSIRQVIFNQNVVASRVQERDGFLQQDEFHGDRLIVDVGENQAGSTDIRRVTFTEGNVFGQSKKLQGDRVVFIVRLNCSEMTYDKSDERVRAIGPGQIQLNNTNAETGQTALSSTGGINFQRPCYALIDSFERIEWDMNDRRLTADGDEKTMQLAYVPLLDGQVEKYIFVHSQKLTADYASDATGKPVIERVFTDKGITYIETNAEKTKILRELVGQTLLYDTVTDPGWLTITGSEAMPCMVNKTRVPAIRYNVNTGQLKTSLSAIPSVLGMPK